jgi:hypothetical protein
MSSDTLIREVDEELRRDRMRKLWRQGGPWVIAAAVAIVLGVAGYEGWMWWTKSQSSKSSDQFYAAAKVADGADFDASKKALDGVIAQGSGGYPMLAQFREAALLSQNGKIDEAVAAYDGLASSLNNTHLRELALILAGNLLIDKGDVEAVQQRVGGSLTPESPLHNAAREVLGLTQYKAGKLDDAMKSFTDILNDPLASQDSRSKIQLYVLQLVAEGAKPIAPPATDATTSASSEPVSSETPTPTSSAASAPASSEASVVTSTQPSAATSSTDSTALDSAQLDVTPPVVVDNNALSMAMPEAPASSEATPSASSEPVASSAPAASSAAP